MTALTNARIELAETAHQFAADHKRRTGEGLDLQADIASACDRELSPEQFLEELRQKHFHVHAEAAGQGSLL
jgi:hypothetical protein